MATKVLTGKVDKLSGSKTVRVAVTNIVQHPIYRKRMRVITKYLCHVDLDNVSVGDKVIISECRRRSKRKSWIVLDGNKTKSSSAS